MEKYHVTKHTDGSWQVLLGTGSKKAIKKFKTQKEALAYAEGNAFRLGIYRCSARSSCGICCWNAIFYCSSFSCRLFSIRIVFPSN